MMGYYDYGWGMHIFGWAFMAIFWIAVIWLIIWLIRQNSKQDSAQNNRDGSRQDNPQNTRRDPQEELKYRYAHGELTHEQYARMKRELQR